VQAGILGVGIEDVDEGRMDGEGSSLEVGAMTFEAPGRLVMSCCFEGKRQIPHAHPLQEGLMGETKWVDGDIFFA
jgi:hypothetical protein